LAVLQWDVGVLRKQLEGSGCSVEIASVVVESV
jgi:hypothetical protein